jgi:hypothetical protein
MAAWILIRIRATVSIDGVEGAVMAPAEAREARAGEAAVFSLVLNTLLRKVYSISKSHWHSIKKNLLLM